MLLYRLRKSSDFKILVFGFSVQINKKGYNVQLKLKHFIFALIFSNKVEENVKEKVYKTILGTGIKFRNESEEIIWGVKDILVFAYRFPLESK